MLGTALSRRVVDMKELSSYCVKIVVWCDDIADDNKSPVGYLVSFVLLSMTIHYVLHHLHDAGVIRRRQGSPHVIVVISGHADLFLTLLSNSPQTAPIVES